MKKILIVAGLLLLGIPAQAQFGKFLKKAGEAVESIKDATNKKNNKGDKGRQAKAKTSNASTPGNSEVEEMISAEYYNHGEIPAWLRGIKTSNMHAFYNTALPSSPKPSSGAPKLYYGGSQCYYSPFSDGVAYLSSYEGENYFFDRQGNILFKTDMYESSDARAPLFNNGVVMEVIDRRSHKCKVRIRDRKGNIIKEFPKCYDATNFVDGIAALHYQEHDKVLNTRDRVKYVDTTGKEVFPSLHIDTWKGINTFKNGVESYIRPAGEGLTPVCTVYEGNGEKRWGFRDATGKMVIPAEYCQVCGFSEGLAAVQLYADAERKDGVRKEGKWGYIDKSGKMVIPAIYTNMPSAFNSGLAVVTNKEDAAYYIDKSGATKLGPVNRYINDEGKKDGDFAAIGPFHNGYAFVQFFSVDPASFNTVKRYIGIIDPSFNIVSWGGLGLAGYGGKFESAYFDGSHYIPGESNMLYCVEAPDMKRTVSCVRDVFSEGLSRYGGQRGGEAGYMDKNGNIAIEIKPTEF